jgi:hypothetical protein
MKLHALIFLTLLTALTLGIAEEAPKPTKKPSTHVSPELSRR